jgi:phosphatidate cytidylyltransferase
MAYIVQTNCQRVSSTQARQCILSLGMKRILTALVLIPLVLLMVFVGPRWQWLFTLAVAGVAALAAWEYLGLAEKSGAKPPRVAVLVAVGLLFAGNFAYPDQTAPLFGGLSLGLLIYCTFRSSIGLTLLALPSLREETNGPSLVAFLLCVVWAGDIAALYVGRTLGRLKLAPSLSPNKTWEGTLGSVAGSMAAAGGLVYLSTWLAQWDSARLSYPEDLWYWLGLAVLVNVAAQVGDLAESALKRSVGVKDSGALLPGHGGVLDRVDALLLAAPVLWYAQVIHRQF